MFDVTLLIYLVHNPVCIVRHCCCKNNELVQARKILDELQCPRSDQVVAPSIFTLTSSLFKMDQSLIKVENKCINILVVLQWS